MSQAALKQQRSTHKSSPLRHRVAHIAGIIFFLLVLTGLFIGGILLMRWMKDPTRLPLSRIVVTGETCYTKPEDIRESILSVGDIGTFMSEDVDLIQRQLSNLPWIKQISVRKQWPDTLKIHLIEYVPVAQWNDFYFLDENGNVFSTLDDCRNESELPALYGLEGDEQEVLAGYRSMSPLISLIGLKVKALTMNDRSSWQWVTEQDVRIELGRKQTLLRLQRLTNLWPVLEQQAEREKKHMSYIDLRYESGAAVGWAHPLPK